MAEGVAFRVLGPLAAESERGRMEIGAAKPRALLATLLLHPEQLVDSERIVEGVWEAIHPATALHLVQVYVSQLRGALKDVDLADRLHTEPNGYRIGVEPGELDATTFEARLADGVRLLGDGREREAEEELGAALALWRGNALTDVELEDEPARRVARLEEQRLVATERLIDARLATSESSALVPELERLVAAHPLREGFRAQLMLGLYRDGRQADALATYQRARATLVDELGIEPSPRLRELESAILRQDPALERQPGTATRVGGQPSVAEAPRSTCTGSQSCWSRRSSWQLLPPSALRLRAATHAMSSSARFPTPSRSSTKAAAPWSRPRESARRPDGSRTASTACGSATSTTTRCPSSTRPRSGPAGSSVSATPSTVQTSGSVVWLGYAYSGRIGRYLARTRTLTTPRRPTPTATGLAALAPTERDVWVGLQDGAVLALDPVSLRVKAAGAAGRFFALVEAAGSIWGIGFGGDELVRIDRRTAEVTLRTPIAGTTQALAAGRGSLWVATSGPDRLYRVDAATGQVASSTPLGASPSAVVVGGEAVWVASGLDGQLQRVDPTRSELVATIRIGRPILALATDAAGTVFVAEG